MKYRPPPVAGERANHRSVAAVTAAGRSHRQSPATGSRRGSEDAVRAGDAAGTPFRASPRRPRTRTTARRNAPCIIWAPHALAVRRPPLPPSRSQLRTSGRTSRKGAAAAHCIRRLRWSRMPRVAQFQTAEATLLDQPVLVHGGDDSPPSIRFLFLSSHRKWHCRLFQWEWRAERSRRRPVPVLHVSEATSKFCNVTKQNVAGKKKSDTGST